MKKGSGCVGEDDEMYLKNELVRNCFAPLRFTAITYAPLLSPNLLNGHVPAVRCPAISAGV
jgi:hypothetical protein